MNNLPADSETRACVLEYLYEVLIFFAWKSQNSVKRHKNNRKVTFTTYNNDQKYTCNDPKEMENYQTIKRDKQWLNISSKKQIPAQNATVSFEIVLCLFQSVSITPLQLSMTHWSRQYMSVWWDTVLWWTKPNQTKPAPWSWIKFISY